MASRKKAGGKKAAGKKAGSKVKSIRGSKRVTSGARNSGTMTAKGRRILPDGAPITVGGGGGKRKTRKERERALPAAGLVIELRGNWQNPSNNRFVNADFALSELWVRIANGEWEEYAVTPADRVLISCEDTRQGSDPAEIAISGGQLQIEFRTGEFPYDGGKGGHYNSYRTVGLIAVNGRTIFRNNQQLTIRCRVKVY
jgi:hypothetical protein